MFRFDDMEIRPEEEGELWVKNDHPWNIRMFTYNKMDGRGRYEGLTLIYSSGLKQKLGIGYSCDYIVHGQNSWRRVFPVVD